jgi:hypothetical membrane protein
MTSIGFRQDQTQHATQTTPTVTATQRALIACGALSSLLYAATDLIGGLRYEGYSFTSQAISELGAVGAPSKSFVDPLFIAYQMLVLLFGVGLLRQAAKRNRALHFAATMLAGYGAIGFATAFAGRTRFAMRMRGAGSLATDAPHIILTAVLLLMLLLAIGVGAYALGRRFRIYSFATLLTVIAFGAVTGTFAARLAAGQATPGLGIFERIDVYTAMLWVAVLSVAFLRNGEAAAPRAHPATRTSPVA